MNKELTVKNKAKKEMSIADISQAYISIEAPCKPKLLPYNIPIRDGEVSAVSAILAVGSASIGAISIVALDASDPMHFPVIPFASMLISVFPFAFFGINTAYSFIRPKEAGKFVVTPFLMKIFRPKKYTLIIKKQEDKNHLAQLAYNHEQEAYQKKLAKIEKLAKPLLDKVNDNDKFYHHYLDVKEGWVQTPKNNFNESTIRAQRILIGESPERKELLP